MAETTLFDRVIAAAARKREAKRARDRAWREKNRDAIRAYEGERYLMRRKARTQGEGEANPDRQGC